MLPNGRPSGGDIVVRHDRQNSHYVIHAVPGEEQIVVSSREGAIAHATDFATQQRVRVWLMDGDDRYVLLQDCRAEEKQNTHEAHD